MRWLVALALAGCYHPKIKSGDFLCGPNGLCPAGFTCQGTVCLESSSHADLSVQGFHGDCSLGDLDLGDVFGGAGGSVTMNTETGEVDANIGGDMSSSVVLVSPAPGLGFSRVDQPTHPTGPAGPAVAIWSFQSLTVPAGVTIGPSSQSKAVAALAACGEIQMKGAIDWSGYGAVGGGPGLAGNVRFVADELIDRMGGGAGGMDGSGGGGGGYGEMGESGKGASGGMGGADYGSENIVPVHMGSGGGGGGGMAGVPGGIGGNGGGAVALFAQKVTVGGTINVSATDGSSGSAGAQAAGGGGGGSGGSILISGETVVLAAGHSLVARGGMGGMGNASGQAGGAGGAGRIWIGSDGAAGLSVAGTLVSDPLANESPTPVDSFPR